jgi:hypothetical protein
MVDRVQAIKWEDASHGGTEDDYTPTEIDPNEDGLEMRAVFLQNDTSRDKNVYVSRDADDNLIFIDKVVGGVKTLTELLAGGSAFDETKILTSSGDGSVLVSADGNVLMRQ